MNPIRLYPKKPTFEEKLEKFLMKHANVIVPILFVILFILTTFLVIKLMYIVAGGSVVESGKYYYHLFEMV